MGPSHQGLTSTKHRVLLIALGILALKKQNSSSLTMCETQLPGAVRILHISLTVGHLPTQYGALGDNYTQLHMNTDEVGKGVNGPMKTTGTNSTSIVEKEAWIFLKSGLSPASTVGYKVL